MTAAICALMADRTRASGTREEPLEALTVRFRLTRPLRYHIQHNYCCHVDGAEHENAQPVIDEQVAHPLQMVEAAGIEPGERQGSESASALQEDAKALQNNILGSSPPINKPQESTPSKQSDNTFQQPKCVPAVYPQELPEDLAQIVSIWPLLSEENQQPRRKMAQVHQLNKFDRLTEVSLV